MIGTRPAMITKVESILEWKRSTTTHDMHGENRLLGEDFCKVERQATGSAFEAAALCRIDTQRIWAIGVQDIPYL
jgi:hypothetical protein